MAEFNRSYWENMYQMPLDDLPWEIKEAPSELKDYIAGNPMPLGTALDAGCGTGNFSEFLARNGYTVTGVDYSNEAVAIASKKNQTLGLPITYVRADLTQLADAVRGQKFDLILDYKVSHHINSPDIEKYIAQCHGVLKKSGRILLVCYSDKDTDAQGKKSAVGQFGNVMFYRTRQEIERLYDQFHVVSYASVMLGKKLNHPGHCFVFEK